MSRALWGSGYRIVVEAAFTDATGSGYATWDVSTFDSAEIGPDYVFTDITTDVRAWTSQLGRNREVDHYVAATGSVVVDNEAGTYTPENPLGYVPPVGSTSAGDVAAVRTGRPMRGYLTDSTGARYPLFYGFIEDFDETINEPLPITTFHWVDGIAQLSAVEGVTVAPSRGAGELVGYRIQRLLDEAEWRADRAVDVGSTTMQATDLSQNVWTELQLTADSDGGDAWIDPDGTFVFADRVAKLRNSRSNTVQYLFTDAPSAGSGYRYETVSLASGMDMLANQVVLSRTGGLAVTVTDEPSRLVYGLHRYSRSDLICTSDSTVSDLASVILTLRSDPTRRPRSLTLNPRVYTNLWPVIANLRLQDRVQVVVTHKPADIVLTYDCFVDGISHDVSDDSWLTTVSLASTAGFGTAESWGSWDSAVFDTNTWAVAT